MRRPVEEEKLVEKGEEDIEELHHRQNPISKEAMKNWAARREGRIQDILVLPTDLVLSKHIFYFLREEVPDVALYIFATQGEHSDSGRSLSYELFSPIHTGSHFHQLHSAL